MAMAYPVLPNYLVACSNTLFLYDCREKNILLVPYVPKAFSQISSIPKLSRKIIGHALLLVFTSQRMNSFNKTMFSIKFMSGDSEGICHLNLLHWHKTAYAQHWHKTAELSSTGCVFGVIGLHKLMPTEEWKVMVGWSIFLKTTCSNISKIQFVYV